MTDDLFNQTPSQCLWEAFSHDAIIVQTSFNHTYPPLFIAKYSFTRLYALRQCRLNKTAEKALKQQQEDLNPDFPDYV